MTADVTVRSAEPNSSYGVRLIQTFNPQSTQDCGSYTGPYEGTLVTDASGNGSVSVEEPLLPNATDAFLILNNTGSPGTDYYTSSDVVF